MSILKKPYEVAVYDDVLIDGIFQEKRLGIIGSDKMMSQNRILEPNLVRNVNGQNKFSFKIYKHYTDTITGEKVYNPFVDWLISERKVKLKYEDKWYDFIVKDISENSADYLYTYQLEDANVQELSKNGFGITLDADLMNNIGDSVSLGRQVMAETDWQVDGDVIVEQVNEALVYVQIPKNTRVKRIFDQVKDENGNYSGGLTETEEEVVISTSGPAVVLAFYSSCVNKPHRFQFIYYGSYDKTIEEDGAITYYISRKDDRTIDEKDCQYYIDFNTPETSYEAEPEKDYGLYLPKGWILGNPAIVFDKRIPKIETSPDSQISSWYRGKRYGFAQQSIYVPLLEKYCQKYKKDDVDYLGYVDTTYVSPTTVQNYISGYNFEGTSGWTATSDSATSGNKRPEISNFYGRYLNNKFISITNDFLDGSYNEKNTYTPYMEMTFYNSNQYVLNSCIRDNRTLIGNLDANQELVLDYEIKDANNKYVNNFNFSLGEYIYNTTTGGYSERENNIKFDIVPGASSNGRIIFKVDSTNYTEKSFKKDCKVYLKITPPTFTESESGTKYYIQKLSLYKKCLDKNGKIIVPDYEAEESTAVQNWIDTCNLQKSYKLFPAWSVDNDNPDRIIEKDSLTYDAITTFDYSTYKPVYNIGGAKVRTVTVKESNYFNILQTIAETFEQWLVINIDRNDDGSIKPNGKKISFKNYRGDNNYACFRYGVNLKDIQRTKSSKTIVTKLVVKQNANELAEDGFCTIQRAGSNPTGENYLYDFQYYHNTGIMDADEYLRTNYYLDGAIGEDINEEDATTNLNGYFVRLKQLNNDILPLNQEIIGLQSDLVSEKAKLEVAKNTIEAATQSIETTREDFRALTGLYPEEIQEDDIASIAVSTKKAGDEEGYKPIRPQQDWFSATVAIGSGSNKNKFRTTSTVINDKIVSLATGVTIYLDSAEKSGANYVITKLPSKPTGGLYLDAAYEKDGKYRLEYVIEIAEKHAGKLTNIALHPSPWKDIKFEVKNSNGEKIGTLINSKEIVEFGSDGLLQGVYSVTIEAVFRDNNDGHPHFYIQPNKRIDVTEDTEVCIIKDISLKQINGSGVSSVDRTAYTYVDIDISTTQGSTVRRTFSVPCKIAADAASGEVWQDVTPVDNTRSDVQRYITEYATYKEQLERANNEKNTIEPIITQKENTKKEQEMVRKKKLKQKAKLNQLFFQRYSRFIQEGTWIDEEYIDDEKYFADAQSVLYNSCYPQVAYNINVLELSQLPGYELFKFELGDKTWAIDDEFFGEGVREEVIITELNENLDDPSKNQIKVQNFKNQFQDLFQKITATVQQTQYNSGSYEKGDALLEASAAKRNEFVTNAINDAASFLAPGKTHDVVWDESGITITETGAPCNQVRIVGGAILLSAEDPRTKEQTWMTGLTNQGISANLITAGRLNTGEIQIMSGDDATFKWDAYGLSAYDATWYDDFATGVQTISGVNTKKFVRFDKNGIYGINNVGGIDGKNWHPTGVNYSNDPQKEIDAKATFALTWEGLKVTQGAATARIGNYTDENNNQSIIKVNNGMEDTLRVNKDGDVFIKGELHIGDGTSLNTPNPNLLPFSNFVHAADWHPVCLANSDDSNLRYAQITQSQLFNDHQTLHVYSLNGNTATTQWCGGTQYLDKDDRDFLSGEEITVSYWYFVPSSYKFDENKLENISTFGFSFKALKNEETSVSDQYYFDIPFKNCTKDEWIKVIKTFKLPCNCKASRLYAFVRNYGEVYFAEFKVERGNVATAWIPNKYDEFNRGVNLYRGPASITLQSRASPYNYIDLTTNQTNLAVGYVEENSLLTENIFSDYAYYFSADVNINWNASIPESDRNISVAFYAVVERDGGYGWSGSTITHLPIVNGKIAGVLRTPHLITPGNKYSDRVNMEHLILYAGHAGNCNPKGATFSNIKITKGTVPENFESSVNNNFSWKFDKQQGIMMWNGQQGSGLPDGDINGNNKDENLVFKIDKNKLFMRGNGEFTGTIYATGGEIGGVALGDIAKKSDIITDFSQLTGTGNVLFKGDITSTTAGGITTITVPGSSGNVVYKTLEDGDYFIFGKDYGTDNSNHNLNYFKLSKQGLLKANNAVIWGELHATSGNFQNCVIENSCEIKGQLLSNIISSKESKITENGYESTFLGQLAFFNKGEFPYSASEGYMLSSSLHGKDKNGRILNIYNYLCLDRDGLILKGTNGQSGRGAYISIPSGREKLALYADSVVDCLSTDYIAMRISTATSTPSSRLVNDYIGAGIELVNERSPDRSTNYYNQVIITGEEIQLNSTKGKVWVNGVDVIDKLNSLGFKGPYFVYNGSTKVGQIYQLGTIVYGCINFMAANNFTVYSNSKIPGPYESQTLTVHYQGDDGNYWRAECKITSNNGLQISRGSETNIGKTAPTHMHYTYFCYSTKSSHHPTIS